MFVFCALMLVAGVVYETEADRCQPYPGNLCVLPGQLLDQCANQRMYMFNNETCIPVYWSDACGEPTEGYTIYSSEQRCFLECLGIS